MNHQQSATNLKFKKPIFIIFLSFILFTTVSFAQSIQDLPPELISYADMVFINGQVLTADADKDFTVAEAVAVRGNRILAVGTDEQIKRYAGPDTRHIDLRGRSMTPGFIYTNSDNAVPAGDLTKNSQWGGWIQPNIGGDSLGQVLATIGYIVEEESDPGEPLFFLLDKQWSGPAYDSWDITTLDEIAPNNPVILYLLSSEGIVNTSMIQLAIKNGFPDDHIHLDRDENGNFTGRAGANLVGFIGKELRPWPSLEWFDEILLEIKETFAKWAREGVTGSNGHMSGLTMTVLNRLFHEDNRGLAVRVWPGHDFLRQNPEGEKFLKRFGNLMDFSLTDDRGPMLTITGASVGPHSGAPNSFTGLLTIEPKKTMVPELGGEFPYGFHRWAVEWFDQKLTWEDLTPAQKAQTDYHNYMLARQHGWNMTGIHNMGSEGIRFAMQLAYEAEQQENLYVKKLWRPHGYIHNIDWVQEDFEYWKAHPEIHGLINFSLDMRTGMNQRDATSLGIDNVIEAQYGMEGLERMSPLHSLLENNVPFHIEGSYPRRSNVDWPTYNIHKAVTRLDDRGRVIAADEALDRETAFLATTRWPARYIGALDQVGSIEPGKLADLVVFDGDIMGVPIEQLPELKPIMTLVGGYIAYEDKDAGL